MKISFERVLFFCLFFSLIFLGSCNDAELVKTEHGVMLSLSNPKIDSIRDITWKVGKGAVRQNVSQGISIGGSLPDLNYDILSYLHNKHGVDSWIVKIERRSIRRGRQVIGHLVIPVKIEGYRNFRDLSNSRFRFQVNYAAFSISRRFKKFVCPSFGHRLKLGEIKLKKRRPEKKNFFIRRFSSFSGKAVRLSFISQGFNGGDSLRGEYHFFIALYNTSQKYLMSDYIPMAGEIHVLSEKHMDIQGCSDFTVPLKRSRKKNSQP